MYDGVPDSFGLPHLGVLSVPEMSLPTSSRALVRVPGPEERAFQRFLLAIEVRKRKIADRQTELATLNDALSRFARDVLGEVDLLFEEIAGVRAEIADQQRRLAVLRNEPPPEDDPEELTDAGPPGDSAWESAFEEEQAPSRHRLAAVDEAEARRLYRDLAKRHHPDLAQDDEERQRRAALMLRVNAAFRDRDLDALRALHRAAIPAAPGDARSLADRLGWATREIARLNAILAALTAEHAAVLASDAHALWRRHEIGEDVVEALEAQLRAQLTAHRARLAELVRLCRRLAGREAA